VRPAADSQDRLFLLQPGSGVRRRLLTRRHEYIRNVRWSPEGTTLAFEGSYDGAPAVFTADVRTLAVRLERREARAPAWSPDGGRLAYVRFARKPVRNSLTAGKLVIRDIKTRSLKVVTSAAGGVTWSPDGDLIAFTRGPDNERRALFVCRQDGSALRRVSRPETREGPATYVSEAPSWSPDGSRLAFIASNDGGLHIHHVMSQRTQRGGDYVYSADWSPDGSLLVISRAVNLSWGRPAIARNGLYAVNPLTLVERRLTTHTDRFPRWQPMPR